MYQHNRFTSEVNIFQKFKNLDFILLFCILLLGIISLVTMYSTDGGEILFHTRSHFFKLVIFSSMMIIIAFFNTLRVVSHISLGLCSTHPFFGKYCLNSNWDVNFILPLRSNNIALVDVVPWSIATRNFFTI